mmetsp:Transcript_5602/g.9329  ORF Transcript_5602/g.9329 Transcript_5602/m.9329 type:complete len:242 (-) Transcript_5602:1040-1765(-)
MGAACSCRTISSCGTSRLALVARASQPLRGTVFTGQSTRFGGGHNSSRCSLCSASKSDDGCSRIRRGNGSSRRNRGTLISVHTRSSSSVRSRSSGTGCASGSTCGTGGHIGTSTSGCRRSNTRGCDSYNSRCTSRCAGGCASKCTNNSSGRTSSSSSSGDRSGNRGCTTRRCTGHSANGCSILHAGGCGCSPWSGCRGCTARSGCTTRSSCHTRSGCTRGGCTTGSWGGSIARSGGSVCCC